MKSLSRADLMILNHAQDHAKFLALRQKIARYTTAPVVGTKTVIDAVLDLNGQPTCTITGKKVGIFCGIAHPDYFEQTVLDLGCQIVGRHFIPDHMEYDPDALVRFSNQCLEQGAEVLVCTEKDRVNLTTLNLSLPVMWVRMRLGFVEGQSQWDAFIERVKGDLARRL